MLYIMRDTSSDYIKIGISCDPKRRCAQIRSEVDAPCRPKLEFVSPIGSEILEWEMLKRLKPPSLEELELSGIASSRGWTEWRKKQPVDDEPTTIWDFFQLWHLAGLEPVAA